MSLYDKAINQLSQLESVFGFNPALVQQGSAQWHYLKCGVISASNADKVVAKRDSAARETYMSNLIGQILTCSVPEDLPFKQLEHGKLYEPAARDALSVAMGFIDIKEVPFIYLDDSLRVGVSPDGLSDNTVYEIKAPHNSENFVKMAAFQSNKSSWDWQIQMQMLVSGCERHVFAIYEPRTVLCKNLYWFETLKDSAKQERLQEGIEAFIKDMDAALEKLGVTYGDHFKFIKDNRSNNQ